MATRVDVGTGAQDVDLDALEARAKQMAQQAGVSYDPSDFQGILRNVSYDQGGTSFDQAFANLADNFAERAVNTPGVDLSGEEHTGLSWWPDDMDPNPTNIDLGPRPSPSPPINPSDPRGGTPYPRDNGTAALAAQLQGLMAALGSQNQQFAEAAGGHIASPVMPTIEVPGEFLSPAIDDAILDLLEGQSNDPLAPQIEQALASAIARFEGREGDAPPAFEGLLTETLSRLLAEDRPSSIDPDRLRAEREGRRTERVGAASDAMAMFEGRLRESGLASLADRGLISLPGVLQGEDVGMQGRIGEAVGREFAPVLSDLFAEESRLAEEGEFGIADLQLREQTQDDQRLLAAANIAAGFSRDQAERQAQEDTSLLSAVSLATGYSKDRAAQLLAAVTAGGNRQEMLADIALKTLEQNRLWNQFMAEFSLDREALLHEIRSGQMDQVMMTIQQFISLLAQSRGGFI